MCEERLEELRMSFVGDGGFGEAVFGRDSHGHVSRPWEDTFASGEQYHAFQECRSKEPTGEEHPHACKCQIGDQEARRGPA